MKVILFHKKNFKDDVTVTNQKKNLFRHHEPISRDDRWQKFGLMGATIWLTGLSGSGKSTIANAICTELLGVGRPFFLLDGDNVRLGLNSDLGFGKADRNENVRRLGEVSLLLADAGLVALVASISPFRSVREAVRVRHANAGIQFVEVFVDTPVDVCIRRDPKGLYAMAMSGQITDMTGIDAPYEVPRSPDIHLTNFDVDARVTARYVLSMFGEVG